jgi:cell division protein FtsQ
LALGVIAEGLIGRVRRPRALRRRQRNLRRRERSLRRRERRGLRGRESRMRALLRPRVIVPLLALVLALGGGWLWLRDSSLVAIKRVSVIGATGPDGGRIRTALIAAARNMTTLDVRMDQLRMAVSPYPVVKRLSVSTQFPHGMRIHVIEQNPVAGVVVDGKTIAVAGDGTLLHDVTPSGSLPAIPLRVPPGGSRVTERDALHAVALLAAAPDQLLPRISQVTTVATHGLVAQIRNGPSLYFGDDGHLAAKWAAVTAVLADAGSAGALYIDVTDPERPAAGAGSTTSDSGSAGSSGTASAASTAQTTTDSAASSTGISGG